MSVNSTRQEFGSGRFRNELQSADSTTLTFTLRRCTLAEMLANQGRRYLPQKGRASLNRWAVTFHDLLLGDAVLSPCAPIREGIKKQWLKAIQGLGKARIWRLASFEFEPQREKFLGLLGRQQSEDPLGCCTFLMCQHGSVPACGVDRCVSGINLNNVMQEQ
jgi:hypothetical protein